MVGPLNDAALTIISCPLKMAEMLAEQYSSVYSEPKEHLMKPRNIFPDSRTGNHMLHNVPFDQEDIVEAIEQISSTAAAGPDRFPAILLKTCRWVLAEPLFLIWRESLDSGNIPQILKTADVVPIHKGGSLGISANYRPVALTSHIINSQGARTDKVARSV